MKEEIKEILSDLIKAADQEGYEYMGEEAIPKVLNLITAREQAARIELAAEIRYRCQKEIENICKSVKISTNNSPDRFHPQYRSAHLDTVIDQTFADLNQTNHE